MRLSNPSLRWAIALGSVPLTVAVNVVVQTFTQGRALFLPFVLAMLVVAFYGGLGPALTALGLSIVAILYIWIRPPGGDWFALPAGELVALLLFAVAASAVIAVTSVVGRALRSQRAALAALRESDAQQRMRAEELRAVLDAVPAAIWIAQDAGCSFITGSHAAHEILRQPPGANLSKSAPEPERPANFRVFRVDGSEFATDELPLQSAARGEPQRGVIEELRFDDGSRRVLYGNAEPLRDAGGRPRGAVAAFVDITRLDEAEHEVRESRGRLAAAVDVAQLGIWSYDPATHVTQWDARCRELFAHDVAELAGVNAVLERIHAADRPRVAAEMRAAALARDAAQYETDYRIVRPDGGVRWLAVRGRWLPTAGEHGRFVGTVMDVTAGKRAEQLLADESRRKDVFIATLAHELRNPLAPIRYATRLLRPGVAAADQQQAREIIERQSALMARLLDDLLDVARVTRDLVELKREALDLRRIIEESVADARASTPVQQHAVEVLVDGEPLWVDGDPARLHQVLDNLLQNAARYTDAGGRITVRARREGARASLAVTDTGIGLAPESLERVFELFAQVTPAGQGRSGLGIGLAVVKRLVELHGGRIAASSPGLGLGSTFTIELPLGHAPAADAGARGQAAPAAQPRGARVLVVDDNDDVTGSLALLLRSHGYTVHTAADGVAAMRAAGELRPDFLLLDLGMPRADGYAVARWLRVQPWGGAVRLIAITGWGQPDDRRLTQEAGFDAHLVKPVDGDVLLAAMADADVRPSAG